MSVTQIIQLVLAIVAAAFGLLHKALPRKLGFILMSIAAALAVIVGIAGVAVSHDSPFLIPFGISLVVGAIIALLATGTFSPSIGDDTAGGTSERLPDWATLTIMGAVLVGMIVSGILRATVPHT
jgi:hypothetical protein